MKKFYCIACLLATMILLALTSNAQDNQGAYMDSTGNPPPTAPLFKERLFTGGSFTAGFYSGGSAWGINPMIGYQFNRYMDGGVSLNFLYTGRRDYPWTGYQYKQINYGGGIFARVYPVDFLFAQVQPEMNASTIKQRADISMPYSKQSVSAPSLLLGGGYRSGGYDSPVFFYMSVMVDVLKNRNSPYVDVENYGQPNEKVKMLPVVNAGVNVGLFRHRYRAIREYGDY